MEKMLDEWVADPIANVNVLNKLIPLIMRTFEEDGENRATTKKVIAIVESIRDILTEREILTNTLYRNILNPSKAADETNGASQVTTLTKASNFICKRVGVLLASLVQNVTAKSVKELIRVLMPFIQGALEGIEDDVDKVNWLIDDCEVLHKLFD